MFRFTTRDLLWLTVVVALVLGWGQNRGEMLQRLRNPPSITVNIGDMAKTLNPGEVLEVRYAHDGGQSVSIKEIAPATPSDP